MYLDFRQGIFRIHGEFRTGDGVEFTADNGIGALKINTKHSQRFEWFGKLRRKRIQGNKTIPNYSRLPNAPVEGAFHTIHIAYTSGHDHLDAERASCLMNTHWNTVWNNKHHWALSLFSSTAACAAIHHTVPVPVPLQISRFQVWGSNPSQGNSTFPGWGFQSQSKQFLWHDSNENILINR